LPWYSCSSNTVKDGDDCSSGTCYITKNTCETAGAIWFGEGVGCKNNTSANKTACEAAISGTEDDEWRSCSDNGTIDNQAACEAANQNWYGEKTLGCLNKNYTNKNNCEDGSQGNSTWYSCSDNTSTDEMSCMQAGAYWLGRGYGCSVQTYLTQSTCESASEIWFESWGRCKNTTAPSTENFIPYYFTKNNDASCGSSGTWDYAKQKICMKIFYRKSIDATMDILTSDFDNSDTDIDPITIIEDGRNQTINFSNFRDSGGTIFDGLPLGVNAIGIYEHDGVNCTNTVYPSNRNGSQQILFVPHSTLPPINW